jgi:hypothetical protein
MSVHIVPRLILLALTVMIAASSFAESSSDVQKGRNGFLIYTGPGGTLEDYIHSNTLSEPQLADLSRQLAAVDQGFRKRGTTFFWVVPPNTPTIYPESMPTRYKPVGPMSRLAQMSSTFEAKGVAAFIDLTPIVAAAKATNSVNVYRKTDTHWTDLGAFAAYKEVMRRMSESRPEFRKQLTPASIDEYVLVTHKGFSGDLAALLGLKGELTEDLPVLIAKSPRSAAIAAHVLQAIGGGRFSPMPVPGFSIDIKRPGVLTTENAERCPGPSLVMYHDSFGFFLAQWMAEHFCSATFLFPNQYPKTASVDRDWHSRNTPTFVVLESVERFSLVSSFTISILSELELANTAASAPATNR